jgi:hypothetical protein
MAVLVKMPFQAVDSMIHLEVAEVAFLGYQLQA